MTTLATGTLYDEDERFQALSEDGVSLTLPKFHHEALQATEWQSQNL